MAEFLVGQLDFILFFYGLAFLLLGAVAVAVSRTPNQTMPWPMLGAFGYMHGASEWLDLAALMVTDTEGFALFRAALMTSSFLALFEFGRRNAMSAGIAMPGSWIYLPLAGIIVLGWFLAGLNGANTFSRYALAFPGASLAGLTFARHARSAPRREKRWLMFAAASFAAYGLAAGLVVPSIPNWSGDVIDYTLFIESTGLPVQSIRGVLACLIAFAIWAFLGQRLIADTESALYARFHKRQFIWTISAMSTILVVGWFVTEIMGGFYRTHVEKEAHGDLNLIVSRLAGETASVEGMVKALAGSRSIGELLARNPKVDRSRIDDVLALDTQASGAREGFITDCNGIVMATAARTRAAGDTIFKQGDDISAASYIRDALAGHAGYHYSLNVAGNVPDYFASFPIRAENGTVMGAAVLKKSLAPFEVDMQRFERSFAMIDAHGVILLTNHPKMRLRTVWPMSLETRKDLEKTYGSLEGPPLMASQIVGESWTFFDGTRDYIQRRGLNHGDWSIIAWKIQRGIFASRIIGIFVTLLMIMMALIYLVGRARWMHDNLQLEKRFELEELARNLDKHAATDPLTNLFNRRHFDRSLVSEISRAHRYKSPLSLMIFDIDHFKRVNDTFGHQVGDTVLVEIAKYTNDHIRASDTLARWGGEEFVILCPGNSGPKACLLAGNLLAGISNLALAEAGRVTCSFGVAQFRDGDTLETFMARADDALYRAKSNGRNRIELEEQQEMTSPPTVPLSYVGANVSRVLKT